MEAVVSSGIENYCLNKSTHPSSLCGELHDYTVQNIQMSQMLIGPLVGSFLANLVNFTEAKRILEIGCFTGYSALCMAERLPGDGELVTLDINEDTSRIAQTFWKKSPHGSKIRLVLGPALESLSKLTGLFDIILVDADKQNYLNYAKRALDLLSPRGVLIFDNCLWSGKVADPKFQDAETQALREVADFLSQRDDLVCTLIPLRDGLLVVSKG